MNIHKLTALVVVAAMAAVGALSPIPGTAWYVTPTIGVVAGVAAVGAANLAVTGDPLAFPDGT